ncbi:porin [Vibrio furnissii]|uniref:porin n=1 Tax=Vibrio furnissii TaxID=29494 RepID=UPI00237A5DD2|nr:porin [Vibrio furnissii]WJG22629.1 porin [Vibrio furnissii]
MATNRRVGKPSSKKQKGIETDFPFKKRQWINMKKTLLALAVITAAGSVNAAEIIKSDEGTVNFYGQIRENIKLTDDDNDAASKIDESSSRAGVDASYKISDGLNLVGLVEVGISGDWSNRKHYIGVSSDDMGSVVFGKNSPIADDVYGAEYSYVYGGSAYYLYDKDLANTNFWQPNMIKYELTKEAFWVKASYNLDEDNSVPKLYELFAGTSIADLSLHTGVVQYEDKTGTNDIDSTSVEFTAEYTIGDALLGATYAHINRDNAGVDEDSDAISVGAIVKVADKTSLYGGFQYADTDVDGDLKTGYAGVEYKFASWGRTYLEYGYDKVDGADAVNNLALGARVYW